MLARMLILCALTDFRDAYGKDIWMLEPDAINKFFHVGATKPLSKTSVTDRQ
jgi:hypothetical protein